MSHTPAAGPVRTPARGSGRGGARQSAGKSTLKRRSSLVTKSAMQGITKNDLKRLARRAGVKSMSGEVYEASGKCLAAFLRKVIGRAVTLAEYGRRYTVIPSDIAYALKQEGITLYKQGCDWTYGLYTHREKVRRHVTQPLPRELLERAAAARAASEVASAGHADAGAAVAAVAADTAATAAATAAAAGGAGAGHEGMQVEDAEALLPSAGSVKKGAKHGSGEQAQQEAQQVGGAESDTQQRQQQRQQDAEEEEQAAAAAAAAVAMLSPAAQRPAASAAAGCNGGTGVAKGRRVSVGVPTPSVKPVSDERSKEIQGWIAEFMEGERYYQDGRILQADLMQLLEAKRGCTAGEVQDVLYALEMRATIIVDGGYIYPCF